MLEWEIECRSVGVWVVEIMEGVGSDLVV